MQTYLSKWKDIRVSMPFILLLVMVFLDQLSKYVISVVYDMDVNYVYTDLFVIYPTINNSGNEILDMFHVFNNHYLIFIYALFVVVLGGLWRYSILRGCTSQALYTGIAMIISGAIGNAIDRMHMPGVLDWAMFRLTPDFHPGINVADFAIFSGLILLCVSLVIETWKEISKSVASRQIVGAQ